MAGQLTTIRLSRGDSQPWGFRLQGGKDWALPLSVSKVNPGSLADQGGLCIGDIIVKICGQNAEVMLHKEAQDVILKAGNNLEISLLKGGTTTWQPKVVPIANTPKARPASGVFEPQAVTKTSLAHNQTAVPSQAPAGTSHNKVPAPFATFGTSNLPLVNKQYNSPINLYSMRNIKDTIDAHSELLAPGVKGINFMKPDTPVNTHSAVYQAILEEEAKSKGCLEAGGTSPTPAAVGNPTPAACSPQPRLGFPAHSMVKHVEAPVTAPKPLGAQDPLAGQNLCSECGRLIVGVFCRINDKSFHAECFRCATCGNSLKNVGHFTINDKNYCDVHAPQAAKVANRNSVYEPLAINLTSGAGFPTNTSQGQGMGLQAPQPQAAPLALQSTGMSSPLAHAVSAMPWHASQNYHHVDAPVSPVPGQSAGFSLLPSKQPPAVQVPKLDQPKPSLNPLYQPTPTPFSAFAQNSSAESVIRPAPAAPQGAPKFSWPPKQPAAPVSSEPHHSQSLAYHPSPGTQSVSSNETPAGSQLVRESVIVESSEISSFEQTTSSSNALPGDSGPAQTPMIPKAAPAAAPAPAPAPWTRPAPASGPPTRSFPTIPPPATGSSIPAPGRSSVAGSKEAPKRGRGQLKPSASPGTRIPVCGVCQTSVRGPFIVALGKTWCPDHFNCANGQCRRSLQDIGFVEEQGQLYCENCFEQYLAPICAKCSSRVKGDCLLALERQWHPHCFACSYCKNAFGNNSFYLEDGQPYCEKDWNELFTTKCVSCGFPIEAGDRWVEALNNNYHSQCFKCTVCQTNLEGQSFFAKGGRPFCKAHAR